MWPTPRATNITESYGTANKRMEKRKKEGRVTGGVRNLATEVQMWPTPCSSGARSEGMIKQMRKKVDQGEITQEEAEQMIGGSLNPKRLKHWTPKIWRTPTAMDSGDNAEKYAARILSGKNKRSSNAKVQETLSMQVAMENLKDQPEKVKEFLSEEMTTRPHLPSQQDFVEYLHSQTTARELSEKSGIGYTTVEHWFRRGGSFSHPSIEHWNHVKQFLGEIKFDKELNETENKEWKS